MCKGIGDPEEKNACLQITGLFGQSWTHSLGTQLPGITLSFNQASLSCESSHGRSGLVTFDPDDSEKRQVVYVKRMTTRYSPKPDHNSSASTALGSDVYLKGGA